MPQILVNVAMSQRRHVELRIEELDGAAATTARRAQCDIRITQQLIGPILRSRVRDADVAAGDEFLFVRDERRGEEARQALAHMRKVASLAHVLEQDAEARSLEPGGGIG